MRYFIFFGIILSLFVCSCGGHSSDIDTTTDKGKFNLGVAVNDSIKTYLQTTERSTQKLNSYHRHETEVVDGVNHVAENNPDQSVHRDLLCASYDNNLVSPELIKDIFALIQNNTIPQLTDAIGNLINSITADPELVSAIKDALNTKNGAEFGDYINLFYTILNYEHSTELWNAFVSLLKSNPEILQEACSLIYHFLSSIPNNDESIASICNFLSTTVVDLYIDLGNEIWIAKLDSSENPIVLGDENGIYPPFIDRDGDGYCDVDINNNPIDRYGNVINIPTFSTQSYKDRNGKILVTRDKNQRAIYAPTGQPLYQYYNAKKTIFALILRAIASFFEKGLPEDLLTLIDCACQPLKSYTDNYGSYYGYSNEGVAYQTIMKFLDLPKSPICLQLMNCLPAFFAHNPQEVQQALMSLGYMLGYLRDNPMIQDPETLMMSMVTLVMQQPDELKPLLQLMEKTPCNNSNPMLSNMLYVFVYWLQSESMNVAESFWPAVQTLRNVAEIKPGLFEKIYGNLLSWLSWVLVHKLYLADDTTHSLASILLKNALSSLNENTEEKLEALKAKVAVLYPSRSFYSLVQFVLHLSEYPIIKKAIITIGTPQANPKQDIFSALIKVNIGLLSSNDDATKIIYMYKMIGSIFNPELGMVYSLTQAIIHWAYVDDNMTLIKLLQNICDQYTTYGKSPLYLFGRTYIDILKAGKYITYQSKLQDRDVIEILDGISIFLLEKNSLLQQIYSLIYRKAKE